MTTLHPLLSDVPPTPIVSPVIKALAAARCRVGTCDPHRWSSAVRDRDPVETLRRGLHRPNNIICRAYYKLCEMQVLLPDASNVKRALFLCEAPGGFWQAARRLFPEVERQATSLATGIQFHPMVEPIGGLPCDGDIRRAEVLEALVAHLGISSCDLITGDGGTAHDDLAQVEQASAKLLIAQIAVGLCLQAEGGTMLVKVFEGSLQVTRDAVAVLRSLYRTVHLYKPRTSKAANSERYVVARGLLNAGNARRTGEALHALAREEAHVHRMLATVDPEIGKAFDAQADQQERELVALCELAEGATTGAARVVALDAARDDVAWIGQHVPCLASCVKRATEATQQQAKRTRRTRDPKGQSDRAAPPEATDGD